MIRTTPWFGDRALEFLYSEIEPSLGDKTSAFEWGIGGSTVWLHTRVGSLCTVEHDPRWIRALREAHKSKSYNIRYVSLGGSYPIQISHPKDLIIIDGRMRVECFRNSWKHLKEGGWLIVDNTDRERYGEIFKMVPKTWDRWRIYSPGDGGPTETTFFRRQG